MSRVITLFNTCMKNSTYLLSDFGTKLFVNGTIAVSVITFHPTPLSPHMSFIYLTLMLFGLYPLWLFTRFSDRCLTDSKIPLLYLWIENRFFLHLAWDIYEKLHKIAMCPFFEAVPSPMLLLRQLGIISAQRLCIIEDFHSFVSALIIDSVYWKGRKENNGVRWGQMEKYRQRRVKRREQPWMVVWGGEEAGEEAEVFINVV